MSSARVQQQYQTRLLERDPETRRSVQQQKQQQQQHQQRRSGPEQLLETRARAVRNEFLHERTRNAVNTFREWLSTESAALFRRAGLRCTSRALLVQTPLTLAEQVRLTTIGGAGAVEHPNLNNSANAPHGRGRGDPQQPARAHRPHRRPQPQPVHPAAQQHEIPAQPTETLVDHPQLVDDDDNDDDDEEIHDRNVAGQVHVLFGLRADPPAVVACADYRLHFIHERLLVVEERRVLEAHTALRPAGQSNSHARDSNAHGNNRSGNRPLDLYHKGADYLVEDLEARRVLLDQPTFYRLALEPEHERLEFPLQTVDSTYVARQLQLLDREADRRRRRR